MLKGTRLIRVIAGLARLHISRHDFHGGYMPIHYRFVHTYLSSRGCVPTNQEGYSLPRGVCVRCCCPSTKQCLIPQLSRKRLENNLLRPLLRDSLFRALVVSTGAVDSGATSRGLGGGSSAKGACFKKAGACFSTTFQSFFFGFPAGGLCWWWWRRSSGKRNPPALRPPSSSPSTASSAVARGGS